MLTLKPYVGDWAAPAPAGQDTLPTSISSVTVEVTTPNSTETIPNPLYQYKFNPLSSIDLPDSPVRLFPQQFAS